MRLVVKQNEQTTKELQFTKGPIYIDRNSNSQISLPDRAVSRQHAVILNTKDGKWVIEDLDSTNKTFLNDEAINKSELKNGDSVRIGEFTIDIELGNEVEKEKQASLEDTIIVSSQEPKWIVRSLSSDHAPAMRLPAKRARDFVAATEEICKAAGLDQLLLALLHIASKQFNAYRCWCALRSEPGGSMTHHFGKKRGGQIVGFGDIELGEKINEAIEKGYFMLMPNIPETKSKEKISCALIAPMTSQAGCFGVLYIDNTPDHEYFTVSDLDYLMLLAIHTAVVIENF